MEWNDDDGAAALMDRRARDTTILVVDDDADILRLLDRALRGPGTLVLKARDGREALASARADAPDLVVLDVNLPGLSGFDVCAALRRDVSTRHVPVLMLTTRNGAADELYGLNMGADAYVAKPFDVAILKARAAALLRRVRENAQLNPLTLLPGNWAIAREVERRLALDRPFVFTYADIRHFKAFNDAYGFHRGDEVILMLAELLRAATGDDAEGFPGHIGGDDFALVTGWPVGEEALERPFLARARSFYSPEDLRRGCLEGRERDGRVNRAPLMTLSVGRVPCGRGPYRRFDEVALAASRAKEQAKLRPATTT